MFIWYNYKIVFQNSNYINAIDFINKWNKSEMLSKKVYISFIQSPIEIDILGRFIIPLTSSVSSDSYFLNVMMILFLRKDISKTYLV